jgi:hypothetical protein
VGKFGLFVLGGLLGLAGFAFAQTTGSANPLCSMIQALDANWGIITVLVVGILGVMVVVSGTINLIQGKFPLAFAVLIGGAVILVATYRLLTVSGNELGKFAKTCQSAQIEIVKPVAKVE